MANYHGEIPLGQRHAAHQWEYPTATARNGATGFAATDLGKLALQQDTKGLYILIAATPVWRALGTGVVPDLHASTHAVGGTDLLTPAAIGAVAGSDARLADPRVPSGPAGGVLLGSYPNPTFASDMATQAELDAEIAARTAALTAHTGAATGTHAATAIAFTPNGNIAATTVQAAIVEVRDEIPTGSGLPAGGSVGDTITNTAPGVGSWASPPASGGLANPMTAAGDLIVGANTNNANIAPTATITQQSFNFGTTANLVDNNDGTIMSRDANPGADLTWAVFNFGVPKIVGAVRIYQYASSSHQSASVGLQGSNNNVNWTEIRTFTGQAAELAATFPQVSYQYYRVINHSGTGGWAVGTVELRPNNVPGSPVRLANPGAGTFTLKSIDGMIQWVAG